MKDISSGEKSWVFPLLGLTRAFANPTEDARRLRGGP